MTMLTTEMPRPRIPPARTRPLAPPHPVTRITAPATTIIPRSSDQKPVKTIFDAPVENRKLCVVPNPLVDIIDHPLTLVFEIHSRNCLLYTSDAADDLLCVDLGGRR